MAFYPGLIEPITSLRWDGRWHHTEIPNLRNIALEPNITSSLRLKWTASFMPSVADLYQENNTKDRFSSHFHVPSFFWTETAHEANGFFGSQANPLKSDNGVQAIDQSYSTYCRFLIKQIETPPQGSYEYNWQFIAFYTLWYTLESQPDTEILILLCFVSRTMQETIQAQLMRSNVKDICRCPFAVYDLLAGSVSWCFDNALWRFRVPVREIERARLTTDFSRAQMENRYVGMHELSRHVIHKRETLDVAAGTLQQMADDHLDHCKNSSSSIQKNLRFYAAFLKNLQRRADAFEQRLQNEILCAYNLFQADDNATSKGVLEASREENSTSKDILEQMRTLLVETRNDGRELTNLVSLLTLLFLPGTFFAGFFGMNFFTLEGAKWVRSDQIWLFFAVTVPVTGTALSIWIAIRYYSWKPRRVLSEFSRLMPTAKVVRIFSRKGSGSTL